MKQRDRQKRREERKNKLKKCDGGKEDERKK
jgi:hypothetical protein